MLVAAVAALATCALLLLPEGVADVFTVCAVAVSDPSVKLTLVLAMALGTAVLRWMGFVFAIHL